MLLHDLLECQSFERVSLQNSLEQINQVVRKLANMAKALVIDQLMEVYLCLQRLNVLRLSLDLKIFVGQVVEKVDVQSYSVSPNIQWLWQKLRIVELLGGIEWNGSFLRADFEVRLILRQNESCGEVTNLDGRLPLLLVHRISVPPPHENILVL